MNRQISKYKARLVVQDFSQTKKINFYETFSSVTSITIIMLMLMITMHKNWEVYQIDIDSVYLNAELTEKIYIKIPEEYLVSNLNNVFRLQKFLYRLK